MMNNKSGFTLAMNDWLFARLLRRVLAMIVFLALALGLPVFAQPDDKKTNAPANTVTNLEDTNASRAASATQGGENFRERLGIADGSSTNETDQIEDEFKPGPGGVYKAAIVSLFRDVVLKS